MFNQQELQSLLALLDRCGVTTNQETIVKAVLLQKINDLLKPSEPKEVKKEK
jgi:hypothetical protein